MANTDVSPLGCTWQRYLDELAREHGGWGALTHILMRRAGPSVGLPEDPGTIERGLRRLKSRGNAPGGQYGSWLLRYFGVPQPLEDTARWMGQYHSRFADLPLSLRESQLLLWDRPPIAESPAACWIHLGLASIAMRRQDHDGAQLRLSQADTATQPDAQVEAMLLRARIAMDRGSRANAEKTLTQAHTHIESLPAGVDRDCYHARWADQRAYHFTHAGPVPQLAEAARCYRSVNPHSQAAFALFRREHGLAYCHWRLGQHARAVGHARAAVEHAGDAGLLRFRAMALQLLARIEPDHASRLLDRASRIAAELEHADLASHGTAASAAGSYIEV